MPAEPRRWSTAELAELAAAATERFRAERKDEPRKIYIDFFQAFVQIFRDFVEQSLPGLSDALKEVDRDLLTAIFSDPQKRVAFRYLAAPPISEDDLKTLASSTLSARALRTDQEQAERVREAVLSAIDPHRFPWVEAGRSATEREREMAIFSSAVLVASQRVGTRRRSNAKQQQEEEVKAILRSIQFHEVGRRDISLLEDAPGPGEFCGESKLGPKRADLVVRLPDRRCLAIECKVSNSAVNSFKRVNHEALGKARDWLGKFGTAGVVPAAVLSGVFNTENLAEAQVNGLCLFWSHRLDDLGAFVRSCAPPPRGAGRRSPS
ncbi:MAG: XamI family restriction endonuclease [Stellaceae bacterium]